jgi:hypothetical protein
MEGIYKSAQGRRLIEDRYREFLDQWPTPNQQMHVEQRTARDLYGLHGVGAKVI